MLVSGMNFSGWKKILINNKKILALIPARGGSKGIKDKNIILFKKKPLIYWSIKAALKSKYVDECYVSTDDEKISNIAKKYGALIPFKRPKKLSTDKASTNSVVEHFLSKINKKYDYLILLQPTSPLRNSMDIDNALRAMLKNKTESLVSISKLDYPNEWVVKHNHKNIISYANKKKNISRRQDANQYYKINGAIYITEIDYYKKHKLFITNKTYGFEMNFEKSIDIDTKFDLLMAKNF